MLILEYFPIFSGHGVYLQHLIKELQRQNCEVSILTADFYELPQHEIIDGINVYRFNFSPHEKRWELKLALKVAAFLINNLQKYDILHIHGHLDIYGLFTIFNKLVRKHTVTQMVLLGADDPLSLLKSYKFMSLRFKVLALMDQFLCISKAIADSYQEAGLPMRKLTYIPQGVDINKFHTPTDQEKQRLKEKLGLAEYDKIVIFIGAIVKRKGVDLLVEAWTEVQEQHPDACLLLVGEDSFGEKDVNKDKLQNYVKNLKKIIAKNDSKIIFTGIKNNVEEYLQCSNIFVLPSRKEGFGNVILEAMACGLPVVVTYMDGVSSETVTPDLNGYIVHNVRELSDSMLKLWDDTSLAKQMGREGRQIAIEDFSLTKIAKQYVNQYKRIL